MEDNNNDNLSFVDNGEIPETNEENILEDWKELLAGEKIQRDLLDFRGINKYNSDVINDISSPREIFFSLFTETNMGQIAKSSNDYFKAKTNNTLLSTRDS